MYTILGLLPIALAIVMMMVFRKKSSYSMLSAWAASVLIAVVFWNMNVAHVAAYTFFGFLSAIDVLLIVFSAILLLNVLKELRFIETIGNGFNGITQDRRIQILIISWLFGSLIEGAAGFGTPPALAAPLLIGLGVPPLFAALASLMANYSPVLFGAAGTPTITGYATIEPSIIAEFGPEVSAAIFAQLNNMLAFINIFVGSFVPFMIIATIVSMDGRKRGIKDALNIFPLCLFAGLIFTIPAWLASFLGPQLPTLTGALVGLPVMVIAVKKGFLVPKTIYRFQDDPIKEIAETKDTGVSLVTAWSPYILIALALTLSRLPWLPLVGWIRHDNVTVFAMSLFGFEGINWIWRPLNNPGLFPFIPVTILFLLMRKTAFSTVKRLTTTTLKSLKHAAIALSFGIALVQIMRFTDYPNFGAGEIGAMTTEIAASLAAIFGPVYPLIAPPIGILGAFVSGSHTVSNVMFFGLQLESAQALGLPMVMMLIASSSGAGIGNMIAINNVIAVVATTGTQGKENELIKGAALPTLICSLAISAILFIILGFNLVNWVA